jgi:ribonuclease P protein component
MVKRSFVFEGDRVESALQLPKIQLSQDFLPSSRLKKRAEFVRLNKYGRRFVFGPIIFQYILDSSQEVIRNGVRRARLGLTIVRKQGSSVERNLFRRRVREVFRRTRISLLTNLDINIRPKDHLPIDFRDIEEAFSQFETFVSSRV